MEAGFAWGETADYVVVYEDWEDLVITSTIGFMQYLKIPGV